MMSWFAVALGGALGACLRYGMAIALPWQVGQWPWATLCVNTLGCLLMGSLFGALQQGVLPLAYKPWLVAGFLGAFTTFSTFALEAWLLLTHNAHLLALAYMLCSMMAGVIAVALGLWLTQWMLPTSS